MASQKKKKVKETAVIFDIGSGHIGATIAVFPERGPLEIVYSKRAPMVFQQHIDFDRFLSGMLGTLQKMAVDLEKEGVAKVGKKVGKVKIEHIICVFSSPWYISQTKTVAFEKKNPFSISKQFINDILERAEKQFQKSAELQKVRKKLGDSILIEKHIIQTSLNGYHTNSPYGKKAKEIKVSLFLSMISNEVEKKTRKVLEKVFNSRAISFHSFALASFTVVRDIFYTEENFLLLDVGGEVTDISLVRDGILHETVSFPTGKNFLLRSVTLDLKTIPEEAHSLVRMHLEGKSGPHTPRLSKSLDDAEKVWLKSLQHSFAELGDGLSLPRSIFLTVDSDVGAWFKNIIQKNNFNEFTLIDEEFIIVTLGEKELFNHATVAEGVARDAFLAIEALFLNKIINSETVLNA